ncbi:MAG: hypothetical protein ACRDTF_14935 [Pseudonocardiaceae bacterium]
MTIGPVQLVVLGFNRPDFQGEIYKELQQLRKTDQVRVIDVLMVHKDAYGIVSVLAENHLSDGAAAAFGAVVGSLVGLGAVGQDGMAAGTDLGAHAGQPGGMFSDDETWDALAEIPDDSAAALILIEHRWAIPLRDAVERAGGFRLASEFVSPLDLIAIGLLTAEEADAMVSTDGYAV